MIIQHNEQGNHATMSLSHVRVIKRNLQITSLEEEKIRTSLERAARERNVSIDIDLLVSEVLKNIYDQVPTSDVEKALVLAAVSFIERDTAYDEVAAQLLLKKLYKEVFGISCTAANVPHLYQATFITSIERGVQEKVLDARMLEFDLNVLAQALRLENDRLFCYLGLHTLYDRYFMKISGERVELPQTFWMRVAMGLALNEQEKEKRALEFYELFSNLRYVSSTPTLFHSGYLIPQLSSCYLSTVHDDLHHIFKVVGDNAQLSKWAGGIGNDWTNIRGTGSWIKSIHASSQGVIPFLKIANDVVSGITKSAIRRGGTCAYLETWHYDIEDFLDLRKNTGDERRRTHDMNTANWIPDLFMKRVQEDKEWTLFSPDEVPGLHDVYGRAFEEKYVAFEQKAQEGKIKLFRTTSARALWRKMLSRLFETGHPWITFKDPCNVRSPQDHAGVVHCSNLCTEITLNTSADETAVCNLGSINLARHMTAQGQIDQQLMAKTLKTAVRMLDNVIDLNFYPTVEAKTSNERHRPIGLGQMGFQDVLFEMGIPFDSDAAIEMADQIGEMILYHAIMASADLARERGTYSSYKGSKWDRNLFPLDTIALLEQERGMKIDVSRTSRLDWAPVRAFVKQHGMRNSNVLSIAPTATISNIAGSYPCIEPAYRNLYVKSNIAGEFTIINRFLLRDLKKLGLWDQHMLEDIKFHDGELQNIARIPQHIKDLYKGSFELDPVHLIKITAARGKWIDQSQSHNVFMKGVSGKKLDEIYTTAWKCGLKTTYYLRTLGASQIEKSTLDASKYGFTQKRDFGTVEKDEVVAPVAMQKGAACNPDDLSCESCQ
ncbi:MAG: ribonucleoside-diphosphate reductase subunit alpha [Candidatus Babeliales bacterium]